MKTNLLSLFIVLLLVISCANNNTNVKNESKTLTTKETLINEGWTELASVSANKESKDPYPHMSYYSGFRIFYKNGHYVAIKSSDINFTQATRHSVTKGAYRVLNETYNGRISYHGMVLYFNF